MARTPGNGATLTNLLQRTFTSASQAASTESDVCGHACVYMYVRGVEASHIKGLKFHLRNGH